MKVFYITAISDIIVSADLGRGDKLGDCMFLTNNREVIHKFLTSEFRSNFGSLETSFLENSSFVVYGIEDVTLDLASVEKQFIFLDQRMGMLGIFLHHLWMVRDNSAHFEITFMQVDQNHHTFFNSRTYPFGKITSGGL